MLLNKYKPVVKFIFTFLAVYGIMSFAYSYYLNAAKSGIYFPDYLTNLVAHQSETLLNGLGYEAKVMPHPDEPSMKMLVNNKYVARVIEGCNGASVIILFVAFVVAFSDKFKPTFIYIFSGAVLIYAVNLIRIVVLAIGLYHYPWREELLHSVIFPGMIYGMVFLLWMFWVKRFSDNKVKDEN
ncbi:MULTISPECIES: exosortase family protein XrtF [Mesoflavibacter]|uniref:exosortase family protein XrtF n=1 Tax=Mesoflavibacter TaxID=444051 RepID=UPI00272EAA4E|nr:MULTISPECIES: exosortase family protein XrtF [Mesoflavibacter]